MGIHDFAMGVYCELGLGVGIEGYLITVARGRRGTHAEHEKYPVEVRPPGCDRFCHSSREQDYVPISMFDDLPSDLRASLEFMSKQSSTRCSKHVLLV